MNRVCDAGAFCLQRPQCEHICHFTSATLDTGEITIRKIKPYPVIPADIEPVSDTWQVIGSVMVGAALAVLVVFFTLMFFTGFYIWSLLI
jgi:hypothetical protein